MHIIYTFFWFLHVNSYIHTHIYTQTQIYRLILACCFLSCDLMELTFVGRYLRFSISNMPFTVYRQSKFFSKLYALNAFLFVCLNSCDFPVQSPLRFEF